MRLSFDDLGAAATSCSVHEGTIGGWYSHAGAACNVAAALVAGRREWTDVPAAGSCYFQVTGSSACAEGPAAGWPAARLDCAP